MSRLSDVKEDRKLAISAEEIILSERAYNLVLGAVVLYGLVLNIFMCYFTKDIFLSINPWVLLIGSIVCSTLGVFIAGFSESILRSFLGFNLLVLGMGSVLVVSVSMMKLDSRIILQAFLITALVVFCMSIFSVLFPNFSRSIGGVLTSILGGIIIAELILLLLGFSNSFISWISAILFSLYVAYDVAKAQDCTKTISNAIFCAVDVYLDVINLFMDILCILADLADN